MFDVGFWELLVMAVIGLLVLGPERLPRAARQLGRWLSTARRTASQLRWQIEREIDLGDQQRRQRSGSTEKPEHSARPEPADPEPTDPEPATADQRPVDGAPRDREGCAQCCSAKAAGARHPTPATRRKRSPRAR